MVRIAVIGAGLAGLRVARRLVDAGAEANTQDKRNPMDATARIQRGTFCSPESCGRVPK